MDIATIFGFVLVIGFTVSSIMESGSIGSFWNLPSVFIVIGGTSAATMLAFPMENLKDLGKVIKKAFLHKPVEQDLIIKEIIELANIARKDGLLALEEYGSESEDEFMKKGIMLIVDGTDPELARNILETELIFLEERHSEGVGIIDMIGAIAPGFGMIGTLIGLINLLKDLDDPSSIGPNMSVALLTTFYGSFIASGICQPISQKLNLRSAEEILLKELMLEGLLSIQAGENPRTIEDKLKTFVSPKVRRNMDKLEQAEGGA